jgi:hypothetical protein
MSPEQSLDRLLALLAEERAAIRGLDGPRVNALVDEKVSLIQRLQGCALATRSDLAPRLRELAAGLRRNAVLLAHARDCLRDVLSLNQGETHPSPLGRAPVASSARLSLRG